ncbi:MAG: hypothetical protein ACR2H5_21850 [Ktedonobacteraceae bacterium]
MQAYGDNFIPLIPVDSLIHTTENPFCYDPACPCHEDKDKIETVGRHVQDGLITPQEATDFVNGKTF